ncbi:MAG: excinuclease subunit [Solirubrobacteraceae bacterium]|nr:excinuclease subunit [Solirubrobacteraceae bacterium]
MRDPPMRVLDQLTAAGNSLFVVEHDLDVVRRAGWVVDVGPGAGEGGGHVLYSGPVDGLEAVEESVTRRFLFGPQPGYVPGHTPRSPCRLAAPASHRPPQRPRRGRLVERRLGTRGGSGGNGHGPDEDAALEPRDGPPARRADDRAARRRHRAADAAAAPARGVGQHGGRRRARHGRRGRRGPGRRSRAGRGGGVWARRGGRTARRGRARRGQQDGPTSRRGSRRATARGSARRGLRSGRPAARPRSEATPGPRAARGPARIARARRAWRGAASGRCARGGTRRSGRRGRAGRRSPRSCARARCAAGRRPPAR